MAGMCYGIVGDSEPAAPVEPSPRSSRRRRLELNPFKLLADVSVPPSIENGRKRQKLDLDLDLFPTRHCDNAVENSDASNELNHLEKEEELGKADGLESNGTVNLCQDLEPAEECPKFGMTSVCGRRRDMEDSVSMHPWFCRLNGETSLGVHFFGVFDGHGCSHVAMKCKDRFHEIVKEELEASAVDGGPVDWKARMERSFERMDKEVQKWTEQAKSSNCRCELRTPQCDAVGSTAVVAVVTPDKIVVANCGDSRAVLSRDGVAVPLSSDHKPDRPDELTRIESAGGRVIYWDGPRVLGVLAMSRAIGDNYLKPFVISEPEVTITERTAEDECLILASDGLWDVVTNEMSCGVARMCLRALKPPSPPGSPGSDAAVRGGAVESSDQACSDASILLTKLALARHSTDNVSVVVVGLKKNQQQSL